MRLDLIRRLLTDRTARDERIGRVASSGFYDADWYVRKYPDIEASKLDPLQHFVDFGSAEGRSPGPQFDADWYLRRYADVREAGVEPLFHYLEYGIAESRQPLPQDAQIGRASCRERV